jgi:N-acetylglucosaminyldiphosphoundecaprenol N-acetyl-beta-D-mannosaminyltransferase
MSTFDVIEICKTRFHKLTVSELIGYIVKAASSDKKSVIAHVNIRGMNFAYELPWYRDFINRADLVFCDGFGVLLAAKIYGYSISRDYRMTAPDYLEDLAIACQDDNLSIFLLAGQPGIVDKAIVKLQAIAPNLEIQGHHGYFEKYGSENDAVIQKINEFKPDILYIGFGMPLQERWILENIDHITTKVFLPLGACLDFYTGNAYRGPRWMTDRGLEWMSRLFTEPRRLWQRYLVGNFLFMYRILRLYWRDRIRNT